MFELITVLKTFRDVNPDATVGAILKILNIIGKGRSNVTQ